MEITDTIAGYLAILCHTHDLATRAKRTVVYGRDGQAYGDPELIRLAAADGRLAGAARADYSYGWMDRLSQVCGLTGLTLLLVLYWPRPGESRS